MGSGKAPILHRRRAGGVAGARAAVIGARELFSKSWEKAPVPLLQFPRVLAPAADARRPIGWGWRSRRCGAAGAPILDLTETNPTRVGLAYPPELVRRSADPAGLTTSPTRAACATAREAVAIDLPAPRHSTSIRRAWCSRRAPARPTRFSSSCCAIPAIEVLVPAPSYPLFEHLTRLEAVEAVPYPLDPHGGWSIDVSRHCRARDRSARAPSSSSVPTIRPARMLTSRASSTPLAAVCRGRRSGARRRRGVCRLSPSRRGRPRCAPLVSVLQQRECLAFALGGLSKSIGDAAAQAGVDGGGRARAAARRGARAARAHRRHVPLRLDARAARAAGAARGGQARARADPRSRDLEPAGAAPRARRAPPTARSSSPSGGWSAVMRVPSTRSEESPRARPARAAIASWSHRATSTTFPSKRSSSSACSSPPDVFAAGIDRLLETRSRATPAARPVISGSLPLRANGIAPWSVESARNGVGTTMALSTCCVTICATHAGRSRAIAASSLVSDCSCWRIGIGATTAIFSLVNSVLLAAARVPRSRRAVRDPRGAFRELRALRRPCPSTPATTSRGAARRRRSNRWRSSTTPSRR